jgi:D-3-phosphoglycerate dehydrogenase
MRVAIIGARWPDVEIEREILGLAEGEIVRDPGTTSEAIVAAASDAEVILAGPGPQFDEPTIEQLNCRGIIRYGVGWNNVDTTAARRKGMTVAIVPDYGTEAVALHTVALVLAALRRIPHADRLVKKGVWDIDMVRPLHIPAVLTAGVIGFGRIGRRTGAHLASLGFSRIIAFDRYVDVAESSIEALSMSEVLAAADVLTVHAPGPVDGGALIGPDEFALMKTGSILVNTARGSLIDNDALVRGLSSGRPAVAALDVFDPEPADPARFADVIDQIIMTPHMAWYTEESELDLRVKTAQEAQRVLQGDLPLHPVVAPKDAS